MSTVTLPDVKKQRQVKKTRQPNAMTACNLLCQKVRVLPTIIATKIENRIAHPSTLIFYIGNFDQMFPLNFWSRKYFNFVFIFGAKIQIF